MVLVEALVTLAMVLMIPILLDMTLMILIQERAQKMDSEKAHLFEVLET